MNRTVSLYAPFPGLRSRAPRLVRAGGAARRHRAGGVGAGRKAGASGLIDVVRDGQPAGEPPVGAASDPVQRALRDSVAGEMISRDAQGSETARVVEPAGLFGTRNG